MISNIRAFKNLIMQLNYILNRQQKKRSIFVFSVIILSSFLELLGVSAILPFVQAMLSPEQIMQNKYVVIITGHFQIQDYKTVIVLIGIGVALVYVCKNLCLIFSAYLQANYSTRITMELSEKMFRSYMARPYTYFLNINTADIQNGIMQDMTGVSIIISSLLSLLAELLAIVLIYIYIVLTDLFIAIGILLLLLGIFIIMFLALKPKVKDAGEKYRETFAEENKCIYETVSGIKEIFVSGKQNCFATEFETVADKRRKAYRTYEFVNDCPDRVVEGICVSGLILIVCIKILLGVNTEEFISQLAVFAMAAFRVLPSVGKVTNRINSLVYYQMSLHNSYDIIKSADEYESILVGNTQKCKLENDKTRYNFEKDIVVDGISWQYPNSDRKIFTGASLVIKRGEAVAFIGKSGEGKTTLADIILGLIEPQLGTVKMDGIDIHTIPRNWSRIIGYVPQFVFLTDDTIRNNIVFGTSDREVINDDKIWGALDKAQLRDFVESLPAGLDTIVGERGIKFSGGQRQRIAIARALYNEPDILVLDEATSALDTETESVVMESIEALQGKITMIIVAHRLTTIRKCDKIYEIKDGEIIERQKEDIFNSKV